MGVLKDPCFSPEKASIFSETQNPKFVSFAINNRNDTIVQKYTISIIDSPGLFEVKDKEHIDAERTNEVIAQTIARCLENEITNIHCMIMFVTFEAGINRDDIESMKLFLDLFGGSGVSVALCVTHADKHADSWRNSIKEQILRHPELSILLEKEKMPIMFMGCVDTTDKLYSSEEDLTEDYKNVYEMRKDMLQFIFAAKEKKPLNQMKVAKKKIEQVHEAINIIVNNFKLFINTNDFKTSIVQEAIITHKDNLKYLEDNNAYMNVPQMAEKFIALIDFAKKFKEKNMDNNLKNELLWPLKLTEIDSKNKNILC